ncbi:MAG: cupin domain-containing protein [Calditrichaeota bacterium]|nr:MAG: cupin domain-containing protein [Calditrichota bacterium]
MKKLLFVMVCSLIFMTTHTSNSEESVQTKKPDQLSGKIEGLKIENLLAEKLEIADSIEIVVSHLVVPPNTMLPMHWHHGEEFVYVLEGSAFIIQKDKADSKIVKGDVFKIPFKQIHTAKTTDDSCTVVVFRVHEEGKPTRVLVD